MKIVQFIDSMYTGGAETSVCNTALEMKRQGLDIAVLCFSIRRGTANEKRLDRAEIPTYYLAEECLKKLRLQKCIHSAIRYLVQILLSVFMFRDYIKREQPDVLHMHLDALLFYPFLPRKVKRKCAAFWTVHSDPDIFLKIGFLHVFRRVILRHNPNMGILVLNGEGMEKLSSYNLSNSVGIIRNGTDLTAYRAVAKQKAETRKKLHITETALVIGHIGRFGEGEAVKNQSFLVKIFQKILLQRPDACLMLVGGGKPSEGLSRMIEKMSADGKVLVLTDRSDVPLLLGAMDVFVLPSVYEGFPMTLIEAQAAGLFCVVSDSVTRETALTDRVCYLPLEDDAEKWADAVLHGGNYEKPVGKLEDYDIKNIADRLVMLYRDKCATD